MTGAILGGSSVQQAAKLQIIITFMIAASTALASVLITLTTILVVVDLEHRIRIDRIDARRPIIYRVKDWKVGELYANVFKSLNWKIKFRIRGRDREPDLEAK